MTHICVTFLRKIRTFLKSLSFFRFNDTTTWIYLFITLALLLHQYSRSHLFH